MLSHIEWNNMEWRNHFSSGLLRLRRSTYSYYGARDDTTKKYTCRIHMYNVTSDNRMPGALCVAQQIKYRLNKCMYTLYEH